MPGGERLGVDLQQLVGGVLPAELRGVGDTPGGEVAAAGVVVQQALQRGAPAAGLVVGHEHAGVPERGRQPPDGGGHHGGAARLRLDRDQPERLVVRRDGHQVGAAVPLDQLLPGDRRHEPDLRLDPQPRGEALQLARGVQAGAARATEHRHDQVGAQLRPAREQVGGGAQQHVRGLERLDPADEQQHAGVRRQAGRGPGGGPVAGGEQLEVDARGHHPDLAGVGVVQLDQLAGLVVGVGHQPVGGLDDLRLADLAPRRLGRVTVGELGVLDPGHGVHRVHERHPPAVGGQPAHLAGEPVVGVHEVVPPLGPRGLGPHHPGGEGAQLARQVLLAQPLVRPGGDVADHHPGRQLGGRAAGRRSWPG